MAIRLDESKRLITIQTNKSTYQMKADEIGTLWHTYYGERSSEEDLSYVYYLRTRGHTSNPPEVAMTTREYSLELIPQETSAFGIGDFRSTAIRVRFANGTESLRLKYESHEVIPGKYAIPGLPAAYDESGCAETLKIRLADPEYKIAVELLYGVFEEEDVITRAVRVINEGDQAVYLEKAASLQLDFNGGEYDLMTFPGRWARERVPERKKLRHGMTSVGSLRGISSAQYNPSAILLASDATETSGDAYGFAFVYSGEFLLEAERDPYEDTRILLGIHPDHFEWKLEPGEAFDAPEALMTFSDTGLSGISLRFHRFISEHIVRGRWKNERRPVLINNWEGTYFNFTGEKLVEMARAAKTAGVELFVLDDGWFGKRDNDKSGLGDWVTNEAKLGCTLAELGDRIRETGLQFGLWFEPETISEDSDLYRCHPDWAIKVPGKAPELSRYELLLDVSRPEVQDHLIGVMSDRILEGKLAYIKWDMNRSMTDRFSGALSADRQGELTHRFMLGTYRILEALRTSFPDLLIEGCSSGGARFDAGMLYYTPQIWTSDDTDALERLFIQYGTSMIYPVKAMGAHVSAVPNHQTGRSVSLKTRATVAMSGTFGYELDPTKLSAEELAEIQHEISQFKELYDLLENGVYYRLVPPTSDSCTIWEQASADATKALVNVVYQAVRPCPIETRFFVRGLCDDWNYRINYVDPEDLEKTVMSARALFDGMILSGKALRTVGLYAPVHTIPRGQGSAGNHPSFQILIEKV